MTAPALHFTGSWDRLLEGPARGVLENEALVGFLQRQRWFAGKARTPRRARLADWAPLVPSPPLFFCVADVAYEEGTSERYALVLAVVTGESARRVEEACATSIVARLSGAESGVLYDGMCDPAIVARLADVIARADTIASRSGTLRVSRAAHRPWSVRDDGSRVSVPRLEQSNSSALLGDAYLLKLFRRLAPGENPDIEVGRALGSRANEARVPELLAWAEYQAPDADPTSVLMVQQQIAARGSAWDRALAEVHDYCARVLADADSGAGGAGSAVVSAPRTRALMGDYRLALERLGARTADLHRTLAGLEGEGFGVHRYSRADLERLVRDLRGHAARALELARARRGGLSDRARRALDRALASAGAIDQGITHLLRIEDAGARIRTHGDFHLGQVLETADGDIYFIDFEGEPARPIAERRMPHSPLRDVAGMLRSLAYAAHVGLRAFEASPPASLSSRSPSSPDGAHALEPWMAAWEAEACAAYLDGYVPRMEGTGLLPPPASRGVVLNAFLLDKALYEMSYELNNRPAWVDIPLDGLLRILTSRTDQTDQGVDG